MTNLTTTNSRRSGRRAAQKARNRAEIIAATKQLLAEQGARGFSIREVVRNTDLAAGTFYNYFSSVDEVIDAIAAESLEQFRAELAKVQKSAVTFEQFVEAGFQAYFRHAVQYRNMLGDVREEFGRQPLPGAVIIAEEVREYIADAMAHTNMQPIQFDYTAAIAIGIAKELNASGVCVTLEDADKVAQFASHAFLNGVSGYGYKPSP